MKNQSCLKFLISCILMAFLCIASVSAQNVEALSVTADSVAEAPSSSSKYTIFEIVAPSLMITYGLISLDDNLLRQFDNNVRNEIHKNNLLISSSLDDYLQYSPAAVAFGMKLTGVKSTHKIDEMLILYGMSYATCGAVGLAAKEIVGRMRPNGAAKNSFPSGHTLTAFVAAEFLHQEFKDQSVWISVGGYTMASFIGVSRMLRDKHWLSDVVCGAGMGILATKVCYWIYPYLRKIFLEKRANNFHSVICPSYDGGNLCLNLSVSF